MPGGGRGGAERRPDPSLFAAVVGQQHAVELLRAAARRPVHAYLVVGPDGLCQQELVRGFAASLLCPTGGCAACDTCRRAGEGIHPDLVEVRRTGALLDVEGARRVVQLAQRRPLEGHRQVLVVEDLHLGRLAAPVLLKTLEEAPSSTVFVLLAESVPGDLATVASRCVRVDLRPVPEPELVAWLESQGVAGPAAVQVAAAAGGNPRRARLLAHDDGFAARVAMWRSVPGRLDGTGAAVAAVASELLAVTDQAVEPLREQHRRQLEALAGEGGPEPGRLSRKELEDQHHREERRWRADELRAGLAVLAGAYRDRLLDDLRSPAAAGPRRAERVRALAGAVDALQAAGAELRRNPNEPLLLEAVLVRLSAIVG